MHAYIHKQPGLSSSPLLQACWPPYIGHVMFMLWSLKCVSWKTELLSNTVDVRLWKSQVHEKCCFPRQSHSKCILNYLLIFFRLCGCYFTTFSSWAGHLVDGGWYCQNMLHTVSQNIMWLIILTHTLKYILMLEPWNTCAVSAL